MYAYLGKYEAQIFALMRIVVGFLFLFHGAQKLFGAFGGNAVSPISLLGLAGFIEFFGGLMVMLGIFTSWVAFICSGLMAVAYFMAHFPRGFWPIDNGGELAALYSFVFLYLAVKSPSAWSLTKS
jgi:putative oxidoreductase